jgi:putative transposase
LYFNSGKYPNKIFADRGYRGTAFREKMKHYGVDLETVKKRNQKGFVLEARRWIVERTLAWLGKNRRLSKDYELITTSSLSMIYLAMVRLMLRRIVELN